MTEHSNNIAPVPETSADYAREWELNSNEALAHTVLYLAGFLALAIAVIAYFVLPPSFPRELLITYNLIVFVSTFIVPQLPRITKIPMATYVYLSAFQFVGIHCYYLYRELQNNAETSYLFPLSLVYGIIQITVLGLPTSSKNAVIAAIVYYAMACLALSQNLNQAHIIWLTMLFAGLLSVCFLKIRSIHLNRGLLLSMHDAQQRIAKIENENLLHKVNQTKLRLNTITETSQMLAHDVRKPFAVLDIFIQAVSAEKNAERLKSIIEKYTPELYTASHSAQGFISDIMELGSKSVPSTSPTDPAELLHQGLFEIFRGRKQKNIQFEYNLNYKNQLQINSHKIKRVLINIIDNAVQAMKGEGMIRFEISEAKEDPLTQIIITNSNVNSRIPPDELKFIFDAFYTKRKKGGTGLGLTICKKIVDAHHGTIEATSTDQTTTFKIRLPMSISAKHFDKDLLPDHSQSIYDKWRQSKDLPGDDAIRKIRLQEHQLVRNIESSSKNRPLNILVVDDEQIYFSAIKSQIESFQLLKDCINLQFIDSPDKAVKLIFQTTTDLVICDIDFGPSFIDGLQFAKELRQKKFTGKLCLHSSNSRPDIFQLALEAGASSFIHKPMSQLQLLSLITSATSQSVTTNRVAIIDDDPFILECWQSTMLDAEVVIFQSTKDFWEVFHASASEKQPFSAIIVDYYFAESDPAENGLQFAKQLREHFTGPILLCSNAELESDDVKLFDAQIEKAPILWSQIKKLVS